MRKLTNREIVAENREAWREYLKAADTFATTPPLFSAKDVTVAAGRVKPTPTIHGTA